VADNTRIKQIIPGSGWASIRKEKDGRIFKQAIVCWALVYETNETNSEISDYIVPMVADQQGIVEPLDSFDGVHDEIVYSETEGYVNSYEIPKHLGDC
jgi:hypothetical protein